MSIAFWCVFIAGVMPIVTTGIAKWGSPGLDNNHPRDWAGSLEGYRRRAYAAHQNSFEAFPFFAAAVLVATWSEVSPGTVNGLALLFIAARFAYTGAYLADQATIRSVLWAVGWFAAAAIFTAPAWAV